MEELCVILNEIRPGVDFTAEQGLIDNGVLDSFDVVSVVNELNAHYGINITVTDMIPENFYSAQTILTLVERLRG